MVQSILSAIKLRAAFVFVLIHAGLIAAIYGIASLPRPNGMEQPHWLALGGVLAVYGGMLLAVFLIVWPLVSLVRRIRKLLRWRDWILQELPRIVELLPQVLEAIRAFFQSLASGGTVASAMSEAAERAKAEQERKTEPSAPARERVITRSRSKKAA